MGNKNSVEKYLDSLPDNVHMINVIFENLDYLPDLSRFKNLKKLYCSYNELTSLPVLPENLEILCCDNNKLTSLPILPKKLKILRCSNNKLILLPSLPENLENLYCYNNQLTLLPNLPEKLKKLWCDYNKLTSLPVLPENLKELYFDKNPICEIICYNDLNIMNKQIIIWNNFRHLYYCLKYRKRFLRIMQPVIKKRYHPSYLYDLKEEDDLDKKLGEW